MLLKAVAVRYAGALYSLSEKAGGVTKLEQDLDLAVATIKSHDGLSSVMRSPTVADAVKRSILHGIFDGKVSSTVLHFLYVLVDKGREGYLETILEVYRERLRGERGEIEATVDTAKPLTAELRKSLISSLEGFTGKKITLVERVDPDLIAGMVVVVGDRVIDTSFRRQLTEIQERLSGVSSKAS